MVSVQLFDLAIAREVAAAGSEVTKGGVGGGGGREAETRERWISPTRSGVECVRQSFTIERGAFAEGVSANAVALGVDAVTAGEPFGPAREMKPRYIATQGHTSSGKLNR